MIFRLEKLDFHRFSRIFCVFAKRRTESSIAGIYSGYFYILHQINLYLLNHRWWTLRVAEEDHCRRKPREGAETGRSTGVATRRQHGRVMLGLWDEPMENPRIFPEMFRILGKPWDEHDELGRHHLVSCEKILPQLSRVWLKQSTKPHFSWLKNMFIPI